MRFERRKGQEWMTMVVGVLLVLIIAGFFIALTIKGAGFTQKVNLEEIDIMKTKNTWFITNSSLEVTWLMSTMQSLYQAGESGVSEDTSIYQIGKNTDERKYWYYNLVTLPRNPLDSVKMPDPNDRIIFPAAEGVELQTNIPNAYNKCESGRCNPIVYEPEENWTANVVGLVFLMYIPGFIGEFYANAIRLGALGIKAGPFTLDDGSMNGTLSQSLLAEGTATRTLHKTPSSWSFFTLFKQILTAGRKAVNDIAIELQTKTENGELAAIPTTGESIYVDYRDDTVNNQEYLSLLDHFVTEKIIEIETRDLRPEVQNADGTTTSIQIGTIDYGHEQELVAPYLMQDQQLGHQGGLYYKHNEDVTLRETQPPLPQEGEVVTGAASLYERLYLDYQEQAGVNRFIRENFALSFRILGLSPALDCEKDNKKNKRFNFAPDTKTYDTPDILCYNNNIWSCTTEIKGLYDVRADNTVTYSQIDEASLSCIERGGMCVKAISQQQLDALPDSACKSLGIDNAPCCLAGLSSFINNDGACEIAGKTCCTPPASTTPLPTDEDSDHLKESGDRVPLHVVNSDNIQFGCLGSDRAQGDNDEPVFYQLYTDTRDIDRACLYYPYEQVIDSNLIEFISQGQNIGSYRSSGSTQAQALGTFCMGDGTCDDSIHNIVPANKESEPIDDRGERCGYGTNVIAAGTSYDCQLVRNNGCCDPTNTAADAAGFVHSDGIGYSNLQDLQVGTECRICGSNGEWAKDEQLCDEKLGSGQQEGTVCIGNKVHERLKAPSCNMAYRCEMNYRAGNEMIDCYLTTQEVQGTCKSYTTECTHEICLDWDPDLGCLWWECDNYEDVCNEWNYDTETQICVDDNNGYASCQWP